MAAGVGRRENGQRERQVMLGDYNDHADGMMFPAEPVGRPVSRVLCPPGRVTVIPLAPQLPEGSSGLPGDPAVGPTISPA